MALKGISNSSLKFTFFEESIRFIKKLFKSKYSIKLDLNINKKILLKIDINNKSNNLIVNAVFIKKILSNDFEICLKTTGPKPKSMIFANTPVIARKNAN